MSNESQFIGYEGDLAQLAEDLSRLDPTPCRFRHEQSDRHDPPLCIEILRETSLGCAHSGNVLLKKALIRCSDEGLISQERAYALCSTLNKTSHPLLRLDLDASHEYEDGELSGLTIQGQVSIIALKQEIRDELIACIRSVLPVSHS